MTVEEINIEIEQLKTQIETMTTEIGKIINETKRMQQDFKTATSKLNQLSRFSHLSAPVKKDKDAGWLKNMSQDLTADMSVILSVESYQIGLYTLHVGKRMLCLGEESEHLTRKELLLLALFAANQNVLIDRSFCLSNIWGEATYFNSRSMDVYICKLRKLLSKDDRLHIVNRHGQGYILIIGNSI
jgi:hypothetical protein